MNTSSKASDSSRVTRKAPSPIDFRLRANVSRLGALLGQTIKNALGNEVLQKIETIRLDAKRARSGNSQAQEALLENLQALDDDELLPVARSFNQFLNLVNIAEQHHQVRRRQDDEPANFSDSCLRELLNKLGLTGWDGNHIHQQLSALKLDLVLTAHPTEIMRRTLIQKYDEVANQLELLDTAKSNHHEQAEISDRLANLIDQIWHTNEIRESRPTPIDEAKWGFALIESSLWHALPRFIRSVDQDVAALAGKPLPPLPSLIRFSSWMGGDRDGNPNVTAAVTEQVLLLGRWMASDLYLKDIEMLIAQLSMNQASDELCHQIPTSSSEPYRELLKKLRVRLKATRKWAEHALDGNQYVDPDVIQCSEELMAPLLICYRSLHSCGMPRIADGDLLDTIRRVQAFGPNLMRLDIRQDSSRHTQAIAELVSYFGLGDFESWPEDARRKFLVDQLAKSSIALPVEWIPSAEVAEVLACCKVIALQPREMLGTYVISMAHNVSDVLSVQWLLKLMGVDRAVPIAPLFETLSDLENAESCIDELLNLDTYKASIGGMQEVMIGYSDSAKDAGTLAAAWAQYQAQERLVKVCSAHRIKLQLFHGRGGTIGRGGAPAHQAILSQPPGSVGGTFRVTEQGEMIRFKFGRPGLAVQSLRLYLSAVLEATITPPPAPLNEWRETMDMLASDSTSAYRAVVREDASFLDYFRQATPEQELARLHLGSRPPKRKGAGGIESLRAIPWMFAWTQNRLLLPAWLGFGTALSSSLASDKGELLRTMMEKWPFFRTRIDMLEMVLSKADVSITRFYEHSLVSSELHPLGRGLRSQLLEAIEVLLELKHQTQLLQRSHELNESMNLRNPYTDPLHLLQAELLRRSRFHENTEEHSAVEQALLVTFAGVAAGMRNTG